MSKRPRLPPNGQYIGDTEPIPLAPDGTYVAGNPVLCPSGKYI